MAYHESVKMVAEVDELEWAYADVGRLDPRSRINALKALVQLGHKERFTMTDGGDGAGVKIAGGPVISSREVIRMDRFAIEAAMHYVPTPGAIWDAICTLAEYTYEARKVDRTQSMRSKQAVQSRGGAA